MRSPQDDLLLLLKTRGPQSTGEAAAALGVTRQAARQQLERLASQGLIAFETVRAGVGRPGRMWSLTADGHARFPDTHAQMTIDLIDGVLAEFGEDGLSRLVARREQSSLQAYQQCLSGRATLRAKVAALAAARTREGYMSVLEEGAGGAVILAENHCPICAAAKVCQGFCRSELAVFQQVLGPEVTVERIDHLLAGARRCAYRIAPR